MDVFFTENPECNEIYYECDAPEEPVRPSKGTSVSKKTDSEN
ncbi:MAG: hypothetical protein ACLUE6_02525 [Acutalibacteraceae bacterium]